MSDLGSLGRDGEHVSSVTMRRLRAMAAERGEHCFGYMDGRLDFWPKLQFMTPRLIVEGFTPEQIRAVCFASFQEIAPGELRMWGCDVQIEDSPGVKLSRRHQTMIRQTQRGTVDVIRGLQAPGYNLEARAPWGVAMKRIPVGDPYVMFAQTFRLVSAAMRFGGLDASWPYSCFSPTP